METKDWIFLSVSSLALISTWIIFLIKEKDTRLLVKSRIKEIAEKFAPYITFISFFSSCIFLVLELLNPKEIASTIDVLRISFFCCSLMFSVVLFLITKVQIVIENHVELTKTIAQKISE